MLTILYFVSCFLVGMTLVQRIFPSLAKLNLWMISWPAAFLTGTITITWAVYLCSYAFRASPQPLIYGNSIVLTICVLAIGWISRKGWPQDFRTSVPRRWNVETIFALIAFFLASFLMIYTFRQKGEELLIGISVWSDFGPHLAVIRSFSAGKNFPTIYPHFAESSIRYHFLFQFLVGNLEFLGLPLDWAFNIPSALSFTSVMLLLYSLTFMLTGNRAAAVLVNVLFFFRSSFAFFTSFPTQMSLGETLKKILTNDAFIGKTANEVWGLWAQNVYVNQRHLSFSLSLLLLILINFTAGFPNGFLQTTLLGILIGMMGFWNGAVVIALLLILGVSSVFSRPKLLAFIWMAFIAFCLIQIETRFFIGQASAVAPQLNLGFLAEPKTPKGILFYYIELLGIFPLMILVALVKASKPLKVLALAAFAPFVLATTVQLTPDVNMNHKFVMISVMLLNIPIATFLCQAWQMQRKINKVFVVAVMVLMTCTGIEDLITLINLNVPSKTMSYKENDSLRQWVLKNTSPHAVFLSHEHVLSPVLLAGRKLYYGWPYYAWSAGYNTNLRERMSADIYSSMSSSNLKELVAQTNINYILIEGDNVKSTRYKLNESLLRSVYPLVFEDKEREYRVYRTEAFP